MFIRRILTKNTFFRPLLSMPKSHISFKPTSSIKSTLKWGAGLTMGGTLATGYLIYKTEEKDRKQKEIWKQERAQRMSDAVIDKEMPTVLNDVMLDLGFKENAPEAVRAMYWLHYMIADHFEHDLMYEKFTRKGSLKELRRELKFYTSLTDESKDNHPCIGGCEADKYSYLSSGSYRLKEKHEYFLRIADLLGIKLNQTLTLESEHENVQKILSTLTKIVDAKYKNLMKKYSSQDELKTDIAKMTLDQRKQAVLTDTGLAQLFKDTPPTTKEVMAIEEKTHQQSMRAR